MILRPQLPAVALIPAEQDAGARAANTRAFDPWVEPAQPVVPLVAPLAVPAMAPMAVVAAQSASPPASQSIPPPVQSAVGSPTLTPTLSPVVVPLVVPSAAFAAQSPGSLIDCYPLPRSEIPAIELRLQHADGNAEILSLPWRLAAVGELSQSFMQAAPVLPETTPDGVMYAGVAGLVAKAPALVKNAGGMAASIAVPEADALPAPASCPRETAVVYASEEDGAPERARHLAQPAEPWLERLCRWIERREREPSIWIRDYRLDHRQAQALASSLQALARDRGVALGRIVINGRDAWSAL